MSRGGKGRGRGRGSMTFNVEAIGFGRGDALPASTLQPPLPYPPLRQQPVPLLAGEEADYLLALQKEYIQTMQNSPYFIQAEQAKNDIVRYSDKYKSSRNMDNTINWKPDWRRLPSELKVAVRKKRLAQNIGPPPKLVKHLKTGADITKTLDALEKKESKTDHEENEEEEEQEENFENEEEQEEDENDYLTSYFDNGENYLDEEEDNLDDKDGGIY
ncbi:DNA-directed RNA polymerase III subunit RPC7-like [Ciona intestinalis]